MVKKSLLWLALLSGISNGLLLAVIPVVICYGKEVPDWLLWVIVGPALLLVMPLVIKAIKDTKRDIKAIRRHDVEP